MIDLFEKDGFTQNIDEIEARAKAATPGPFTPYKSEDTVMGYKVWGVQGHCGPVLSCGNLLKGEKDANFYAHARQDIEELCAEVRDVTRQRDAAVKVGDEFKKAWEELREENARLKEGALIVQQAGFWGRTCGRQLTEIKALAAALTKARDALEATTMTLHKYGTAHSAVDGAIDVARAAIHDIDVVLNQALNVINPKSHFNEEYGK